MTEEVVNGNKIIAKFMGGEFRENLPYTYIKSGWFNTPANNSQHIAQDYDFKYHKSWEWLMPVVEKIEKENYGFKICRKVVEIYLDDSKETIIHVKEESKIKSLFKAVVEFIKIKGDDFNN